MSFGILNWSCVSEHSMRGSVPLLGLPVLLFLLLSSNLSSQDQHKPISHSAGSARAEGTPRNRPGRRDTLRKETSENKTFPEPTRFPCPCFVSVEKQSIYVCFWIVCFPIRAQLYSQTALRAAPRVRLLNTMFGQVRAY